MKGQIQSKETFIKYVVKFVSTLKKNQHLLPKSLALWMWLEPRSTGCSRGLCIPVPGGGLRAPFCLGCLPMALLPLLLRLNFKFPALAGEVQM